MRGEIAPWTARFDVFVKHRSPSKHNSYRHFAAQCSESESVYATRSTKNVQTLIFWDKKRTAIVLLSFRRRYFTMGIVKIYNVLGGFYVNYSTIFPFKSVHKLHKSYTCFLYTLYSTFFPFSKKTFSLASTPPLSQLQHQLRSGIMLQIHLFQSFLFPKEGLLIYGVHHYFPE